MADDKATTAASPVPAGQNEQRTATIRYIDRPEIDEVFADSVTGLLYDGQTLRMEFAVTRFDEIKPNAPISGRRYPACRLALSPAAAIDLINRMHRSPPRSPNPARQSRRRGRARRRKSFSYRCELAAGLRAGDALPVRRAEFAPPWFKKTT